MCPNLWLQEKCAPEKLNSKIEHETPGDQDDGPIMGVRKPSTAGARGDGKRCVPGKISGDMAEIECHDRG